MKANIYYTEDNSLFHENAIVMACWYRKDEVCEMFEVDYCIFCINADGVYRNAYGNLKAELIINNNKI